MKHPLGEEAGLARLLREGAAAVGAELNDDETATLLRHLELVLEANKTLNLTRISEPAEAVRLHIVDSLCAVVDVSAAPVGEYADIGSGAGYPGIPVAVASGRKATLIESVGKKAEFLRTAMRELGVESSARVFPGRAEELARTGAAFAVVTARAVSHLASLVELASPLLAPDGVFVALKGNPGEDEIARGDAAAELVGLERRSTRTLILPSGSEQRTVLCYAKVREPDLALPRANGRAQSHPIG